MLEALKTPVCPLRYSLVSCFQFAGGRRAEPRGGFRRERQHRRKTPMA
jgi:hypothetical protein